MNTIRKLSLGLIGALTVLALLAVLLGNYVLAFADVALIIMNVNIYINEGRIAKLTKYITVQEEIIELLKRKVDLYDPKQSSTTPHTDL